MYLDLRGVAGRASGLAMMRRALVAFFRQFVLIFYRRVDVLGADNIPQGSGVVFAVNHPNGLVDPLFVLCYAPREVALLAKSTLFHMPLIGWFTRKLDSIPVYRKQDEVAGSNRETFTRARAVLARGGGIAIFPEGTTHSDPQLRELKTGAARIALGSAASEPIVIVPTGIYYAAKQTFRSDALVVFGRPLKAEPVALDADGEPPAEAVRRLTEAIDLGLDGVTLQADSHAALELVAMAEDIFSAADAPRVASEFSLRRRFLDGYQFLRERDPARLAKLQSEIIRFDAELERARLEPHELVPHFRLSTVVTLVVLLPLAVAGAILHYPAYRLVGFLAKRFSRGENEMTATIKVVAALLFFPLTWTACALLAVHYLGSAAAVITFLACPLLGWIALRVFEKVDVLIGRVRAMSRRDRYHRLVTAREAILSEIVAVAEEMQRNRCEA